MRKVIVLIMVLSLLVSCGADVIQEKVTTYRVQMHIDSDADLNGIPTDLEVVMHWDGSLRFYIDGEESMVGSWRMKGTKVTVEAKGAGGKAIGGDARLTLSGGRLGLEVTE